MNEATVSVAVYKMKQPVESMMATIVLEQHEEEWLVGTARVANEEEKDDQECRNDMKTTGVRDAL